MTISTPRSRLGSENLFEELEGIIQSLPPVGTTKPPLYPRYIPVSSHTTAPKVGGRSGATVKVENSKRSFRRLVNKPIKAPSQAVDAPIINTRTSIY
jgi:hypothetical protein